MRNPKPKRCSRRLPCDGDSQGGQQSPETATARAESRIRRSRGIRHARAFALSEQHPKTPHLDRRTKKQSGLHLRTQIQIQIPKRRLCRDQQQKRQGQRQQQPLQLLSNKNRAPFNFARKFHQQQKWQGQRQHQPLQLLSNKNRAPFHFARKFHIKKDGGCVDGDNRGGNLPEEGRPPRSPEEDEERGIHHKKKFHNNHHHDDDAPDNYSQAYFEDRIQTLRARILDKIPHQDDLDFGGAGVFASILKSLEAARRTLSSSEAIKEALQSEQTKHPDDSGWKDSAMVDPVERSTQEAQVTVECLEEAATKAGCAIVEESGLLKNDNDNDNKDDPRSLAGSGGGKDDETFAAKGSLWEMERDLLECTVLTQATPYALADWCAESPEVHHPLLDRFLRNQGRDDDNNDDNNNFISNSLGPMAKFLAAGGPSHGNYGRALVIYDKLLDEVRLLGTLESETSPKASSLKLWQNLALAVALELATPISIFKQEGIFVDPVERFRYYARFSCSADVNHNNGDDADADADEDALDKAFSTLSVWELRKVVNSDATHDDLTWGRQFLRNYRPDQIYTKDQKWRYVVSVKTDVGYRHPDHEFSNYQELLSAGGECGPRAFFGRFIAKAWGLPTWGVRQPGHAAMTRWTNDTSLGGWTVCLGAGWQYSWWEDDRYGRHGQTRHGPDFLEETQARTAAAATAAAAGCPNGYYKKVVLLECLAESLGETVEEDFSSTKFWRSLALAQRKLLAREFGAVTPSSTSNSGEDTVANRFLSKDDDDDYEDEDDAVSGIHEKELHQLQLWDPRRAYRPRDSDRVEARPRRLPQRLHHQQQAEAGILCEFGCTRQDLEDSFSLLEEEKNHLVVSMERTSIHDQVSTQSDGTIIIPATSFVDPKKPSRNVMVMRSFLGGDQLHLEHDGEVEYLLPSSIATRGAFALSVKVVNVHRDQKPLQVKTEESLNSNCDNDDDDDDDSFLDLGLDLDGYEIIHLPQEDLELEVQYTKGTWEETKSIRVNLSPGGRLKLSRKTPCWGLSIKEIVLRPI